MAIAHHHDQMVSRPWIAFTFVLLGFIFFQAMGLSCTGAWASKNLATDAVKPCELASFFRVFESLALGSKSLKATLFAWFPLSWFAVYTIGIWLCVQWLLSAVLPARELWGEPQKDGVRLRYGVNGLACLLVSLALLVGAYRQGFIKPLQILAHGPSIFTTFQLFFLFLALALQLRAYAQRRGYPSGSWVLDYFLGVEINPRFGPDEHWSTDVKYFIENRALICWVCYSLLLAWAQQEIYGHLSLGMLLSVSLQFIYVFHHFLYEPRLLGMLDFTTEHMGWMLTWGNGVLVQLGFSAAAMQLLHQPNASPFPIFGSQWLGAIFVLLFGLGGLYIFSSANRQKFAFRRRPQCNIWSDRPAKFMQTKRGTRLLLSGWWGLLRHGNYTGDMLLALSFGLAAGSAAGFGAYFYALYLWALLLHREMRDDEYCAAKYGADWKKYCAKVPYRLFPWVY